jgi:acetyl esterase/lipase
MSAQHDWRRCGECRTVSWSGQVTTSETADAYVRDPRDVLTRPAPSPDCSLAYGDDPNQVADLWLPQERRAAPLVIFVHGGFWRTAYDRTHTRPLAADLVARGYIVAAIEYRRVGDLGGGWTGSFDDVALAIDRIPELAAAAGAAIETVVLAGHSAGGHLALWGAVRHRLPAGAPWRRAEPPALDGILALAPISDLADTHRRDLGNSAVAELLGGGPLDVPDAYAVVDPAALPPPDVPTIVLHGDLDDRVPIAQSRAYGARGVRLLELGGVEHFALIDPLSHAWPLVVAAFADLSRADLRGLPDA